MTRQSQIERAKAAPVAMIGVLSFRPSEAKEKIGVHPATVYRWLKRGLPAYKIDGTTLILATDYLEFVQRMGDQLGD